MKIWWSNLVFSGKPSYILAKTLQGLKFFIKKWGRETFGSLQAEVDRLDNLIKVMDSLEEINPLSQDDYAEREDFRIQHKTSSLNLARKWHARSKGRWLMDGERNSRFFHKNASYKYKVNGISSLLINEILCHDKDVINTEAKTYYSDLLIEDFVLRPSFDDLELPYLSVQHGIMLEKPFEEEEVRKVINHFGLNKSPGPDGYTMEFFKATWDIIKPELMNFFNEFHSTGNLYWRLNCTNIILLPKCEGSSSMNNYRPINLIGGIYKVIYKCLADGIKIVMPSIISKFQGAFVDERHITYGILIASELTDARERPNIPGLILMVDL